MKTLAFALFMIVCQLVFSQAESTRGAIKVKKIPSDTICEASVSGYTGTKNYITTKELLTLEKLEFDRPCNYEIVSFGLSYIVSVNSAVPGEVIKEKLIGDTITFKKIQNREGISILKIHLIVAKNKYTGQEKTLPIIIFYIND